jgi:hypothetical protein
VLQCSRDQGAALSPRIQMQAFRKWSSEISSHMKLAIVLAVLLSAQFGLCFVYRDIAAAHSNDGG